MTKIKTLAKIFNAPTLLAMVGSALAAANFTLLWLEKIPQYDATFGIIVGLILVCLSNLWIISDQNRETQRVLVEAMKISVQGLKMHHNTLVITETFVKNQGTLVENQGKLFEILEARVAE